MRTCLLGLVAGLMVGCKTPPPGIDPFLRTRVPPPASGEAAPLYGGAYDPAQPGAVSQPGAGTYQPPAASDSGAQPAPMQAPPGGQAAPMRFRTSASREAATQTQEPASELEPPDVELAVGEAHGDANPVRLAAGSAPAGPPTGVVTAEYQSEIRILTPEDSQASETAASDAAAGDGEGEHAPGVAWQGTDEGAADAGDPHEGGLGVGARPVPAGDRTGASGSRLPYAYDPAYTWLRGKLEYSQRDRRWKLRYIPVDGSTDQYGGSVVLTNPQKLDGFEPGEFVEVQGALAGRVGREPFAPGYRIERIVPQDL